MNHSFASPHVSLMIVPNLVIIHHPWVKEMSGESGNLLLKLEFCKANIPTENEVISIKQPILQSFFFHLLFKYLVVFTAAIWKMMKRDRTPLPKIVIQKLILVIFNISDPLERLIKIITKVG